MASAGPHHEEFLAVMFRANRTAELVIRQMVVLLDGINSMLQSLPAEQAEPLKQILFRTESEIANLQEEIHTGLYPTPRQRRLAMFG
jgi:hypothetical protein